MDNLILRTDSYKASHFPQYPPKTTSTMCYLESRGGRFRYTVWFGLQYLLKRYLSKRISFADVAEAREILTAHGLPFNEKGWERVLEKHGGYIPLRIRAVPEGSVVPVGNVLMTVESTDPELFWLPNYFETLLERVWYPTTVATLSRAIRSLIYAYLALTSDTPDADIPFKLHDFGARGVSSAESAAIGDVGHLVNFMGTDTLEGIMLAREYYHEPMAGFSIPAAEHSTITSWGEENECQAFKNMLDQFAKPGKLVAVVSDSYDLKRAVQQYWGNELRQQVINSGATVIIRPDSGEPDRMVLETLIDLEGAFGSTVNRKGFKVLNHVRVIQGDGVDINSIRTILQAITGQGFSATNVAFGSGGALLQKLDRDTQRFAYKMCEANIDGKSTPIFKNPATDPGKRSKGGRLDLILNAQGEYETALEAPGNDTQLRTVYLNGQVLADATLAEIRKRAWPDR